MEYYKVKNLIRYHFQDLVFIVLVVCPAEVKGRDDNVEDKVKRYGRKHDEHGAVGKGGGMAQLGEFVHEGSEGECNVHKEEEDYVDDY